MIVVDTHIIIWNALKPEMLSEKAEKAISAANNSVRSRRKVGGLTSNLWNRDPDL